MSKKFDLDKYYTPPILSPIPHSPPISRLIWLLFNQYANIRLSLGIVYTNPSGCQPTIHSPITYRKRLT